MYMNLWARDFMKDAIPQALQADLKGQVAIADNGSWLTLMCSMHSRSIKILTDDSKNT